MPALLPVLLRMVAALAMVLLAGSLPSALMTLLPVRLVPRRRCVVRRSGLETSDGPLLDAPVDQALNRGQQHHRKGGNHPQQNRQERRHEPHAPAQGSWSGHPQRPQTQQPAQPHQHSQHGDRQPAPQRAQTQQFPALFGTYRRKAG